MYGLIIARDSTSDIILNDHNAIVTNDVSTNVAQISFEWLKQENGHIDRRNIIYLYA